MRSSATPGFTAIEGVTVRVAAAFVVAIVVCSCEGKPSEASSAVASRASVIAGIRYQPPIVPISIAFTNNGLSVTIEGRIQTPVGTFAAFSEIDNPTDDKVLAVAVGDAVYTYELDNRTFQVQLPNDLNGATSVTYDGKGNIRVVVPHPVLRDFRDGDQQGSVASTVSFVVDIENPTTVDLSYDIREVGGVWAHQDVAAGAGWVHNFESHAIDIRFDSSLDAGVQEKCYRLDGTQYVGDPNTSRGRVYRFGIAGSEIDLTTE
jgi:hypothetical protein